MTLVLSVRREFNYNLGKYDLINGFHDAQRQFDTFHSSPYENISTYCSLLKETVINLYIFEKLLIAASR